MKQTKWVLGAVAALFAVGLTTVLVIDNRQRQPIGAPLAPAEVTFSLAQAQAQTVDLLSAQWVDTGRGMLLTGQLQDRRKPDDEQPLPGEVLDVQVPERANELRQRANALAAGAAATMLSHGHADLAALALQTSRDEKRQYMASLVDGEIRIAASLAGDRLEFMHTPGGKRLLLDSGMTVSGESSNDPILKQAYVSADGGRNWRFDAKQLMPWSLGDRAFVSDLDGYQLHDDLLLTRDGGRSWAKHDLEADVWGDLADKSEDFRYAWMLVPGQAGQAQGWSTRWVANSNPPQSWEEKARREQGPDWVLEQTRRFELSFVPGQRVRVTHAPEPDLLEVNANSYDLHRAPNGSVTWKQAQALRHLDAKTWRWGPLVRSPAIGDVDDTYIDQLWVKDGVWLVRVHGRPLWSHVACMMPPFFRSTRGCGDSALKAHFVSSDQGKNWLPFQLIGNAEVLGWDDAGQRIVVFEKPSIEGKATATVSLHPAPVAGAP